MATPRVRITDRDKVIFRSLADLGACTYPQLQRLTGMTYAASRQRLRTLREVGYVAKSKTYSGTQRLGAWLPTQAGLGVVGRGHTALEVDEVGLHAALDRAEKATRLLSAGDVLRTRATTASPLESRRLALALSGRGSAPSDHKIPVPDIVLGPPAASGAGFDTRKGVTVIETPDGSVTNWQRRLDLYQWLGVTHLVVVTDELPLQAAFAPPGTWRPGLPITMVAPQFSPRPSKD